jgi:hypothetical protein
MDKVAGGQPSTPVRVSRKDLRELRYVAVDDITVINLVKSKFVANLPITFPSSEIGRELRNKVRKFISMFELRL